LEFGNNGPKLFICKACDCLANKRLKTARDIGRYTRNLCKLMHTNRQLNVKVSIGLEDAKSKLVFGINNPVQIDHGSTTLSYAHFLNLNNDRILKLCQQTNLEILNKQKYLHILSVDITMRDA